MSTATENDLLHLQTAIALAKEAESSGNLPIAALIVMDGEVMSRGTNSIYKPVYDPGRHAEIEALRAMPDETWHDASRLTCYTTLEPCLMCASTLVMYGVRRIVFGSSDPWGGGSSYLDKMPPYLRERAATMTWIGPAMPEVCDELYERAVRMVKEWEAGTRNADRGSRK